MPFGTAQTISQNPANRRLRVHHDFTCRVIFATFQQWQHAKFGLVAGTAVTVGVVVVVAPLVALL